MRLLLWVIFLALQAFTTLAGTYELIDGATISGEPVSFNDIGVVLKTPEGAFRERIAWSRFSQTALQVLAKEAKRPQDARYIVPFLQETTPETKTPVEVKLETPPKVDRPTGRLGLGALAKGNLGAFLLLCILAANLYAAWNVAVFTGHPRKLVMASSAVVPWVGPLIWLAMPRKVVEFNVDYAARPREKPTVLPAKPSRSQAPPVVMETTTASTQEGVETAAAQDVVEHPQRVLPEPVIYARGEFIFNKRFFETKLPGFFRLIPSEGDREKVLYIKSARGDFVGRRIAQVTPAELYLHVVKGSASADEMIPFNEINEVQVVHESMV